MAFTDEARVREHTGLTNPTRVPSSLVQQRIEDAHETLLRDLDPAYVGSSDPVLILGETELATANLLRSLAAQIGVTENQLTTAGLSQVATQRTEKLQALADSEEARAWQHLRPFLKGQPDEGFALAEPEGPRD